MNPFEVIFDNAGGITIQGEGFAVAYEAHDDVVDAAADDAKALLDGADPSDWEGNNEANRETNTQWCKVYDDADLQSEMTSQAPIRVSGATEARFLARLTGRPVQS